MIDDDDYSTRSDSADHESTRVISRSFELGGVAFSWWAVDESPSLVTVSRKIREQLNEKDAGEENP